MNRLKIGLNGFTPIYIKESDATTGVVIFGKAGGGKTGLITNWIFSSSFLPGSMVIIDPAGFMAREAYSALKGKAEYVSLDTPMAFNMLKSGYEPSQICSIVGEAINQVILMTTPNERLTVKMREILDEAINWCLERNRKSLLHVLDYLKNAKGHGETRDGIIARLNFLLSNPKMEAILCGNNSIQWGKFIAEGKRLVLDCFGMTKEEFVFIGSIITLGIKSYFRHERVKEYKPLRLFIDEAHNFLNQNFFDILKEGRKYQISCIMATQDLIFDDRLARVMLNVGSIIAFRLGAREAGLVAQEMSCEKDELIFMEKYHVAYKTPSEKGICKVPRPPMFKHVEPKRVEPQRKSKGWFPLESYQPA